MDCATRSARCPDCGQPVEIELRWTPGGVNDYGGFVLKCDGCGNPFHVHIGRDVMDSYVVSGATLLGKYDDHVEGDKAKVFEQHGLPTEP